MNTSCLHSHKKLHWISRMLQTAPRSHLTYVVNMCMLIKWITKTFLLNKCGGLYLLSQHLGDWERRMTVGSRPSWTTHWVPGQPRLSRNALSQRKKNNKGRPSSIYSSDLILHWHQLSCKMRQLISHLDWLWIPMVSRKKGGRDISEIYLKSFIDFSATLWS